MYTESSHTLLFCCAQNVDLLELCCSLRWLLGLSVSKLMPNFLTCGSSPALASKLGQSSWVSSLATFWSLICFGGRQRLHRSSQLLARIVQCVLAVRRIREELHLLLTAFSRTCCWESWCSFDILKIQSIAAFPADVSERRCLTDPPCSRRLGPCDSVYDLRTSTKLGYYIYRHILHHKPVFGQRLIFAIKRKSKISLNNMQLNFNEQII